MIRGLALETSGQISSVALAENGEVVAEDSFPHGLKHAAGLIPMMDRLCRERGWTAQDLREVYVSTGPGSFTGLRAGITAAKVLALALGASVVPVPTMRVIVENGPPGWQHAVVLLDAKRGQVFAARFFNVEGRGYPIPEEPPHLDTVEGMLARAPRPVHLLGEGIPYHRQFIPQNDPEVIVTPPELWRARASVVARLGYELSCEGLQEMPERLAPLYVRKPEAEEKYDEKHGAGPAGGRSHP